MQQRTHGVHPFCVFVLNPAGYGDPALAIAASRAGAIGVLNDELGGGIDLDTRLAQLRLHARKPFGLKLAGVDIATLERVLSHRNGGLAYLILDATSEQRHHAALADFRAGGGRVMVEITEWEPALSEREARLDGLWIKGHEAGGWVGEQTSFILLQEIAGRTALPVFVRGGVNIHSAAACKVGGAAGVVLDDQMLLLRDCPLREALAPKLRFFTGLETILLDGRETNRHLRIWSVPGRNDARELQKQALQGGRPLADLAAGIGWSGEAGRLVPPLGQDASVAMIWGERYGSVAAVLRAIEDEIITRPQRALTVNILGADSPLAQSHGTRLPIVQGPMTHVSDRVPFIEAIAAGGGLPMVAVSLMKGDAVTTLLAETSRRLGEKAWGVGLLGFVPPEILNDQRRAVRESRPPFAIIAGGRPDQAQELEAVGIRTYLHVPSPVLLEQFLEQGGRRFIFEGRECGGHIGPLSSFVLWGRMVDTLLGHPLLRDGADTIHVLFAGGIHDARSAAMAATIALPLAEKGVRVGILMGTAYVFTAEAVESQSITPTFQEIAVACAQTVGLATGPGHASRCAVTPFVQYFFDRRQELEKAGVSADEIREDLEKLSLGRLRMATKGEARLTKGSSQLSEVPPEDQVQGGMFMIGQAATMIERPTTVAEVHRLVSDDAIALLARQAPAPQLPKAIRPPADIAVIGVGSLLPGSHTTRQYWENILEKVDAIREVPPERWDWSLYYDSDKAARDKIYSKWGGFIDDLPFDPVRFGMPPNSVSSIDPMQLLALAVVQQTLEDAGYADRRTGIAETTSVILGFSGGLGELGIGYGARSEIPRAFPGVAAETLDYLPEWTEDSFAGILPNVSAGRVANRFNFGGANFTTDAACASSLSAIYQAVQELETGRSDMVLAGGIDTVQGPFAFLCFSKSQALSPSGRCRTFDAKADGIVISEGVAVVALKRLADAERDGDRIYAVIKGVGASSDGRAKGLTAPLPAGQQRALRRAYAQAGFSPATLGMIEAHGTGTVAGDRAELETVIGILGENDAAPASTACGSVKTMIGHTKSTAGVAGLIKASLALYHKVQPPHLGVTDPNPVLKAPGCPVYLNQLPRPWIRSPQHPRRAGVSSFGFGGTNFHVALEEYGGEYRSWAVPAVSDAWPAELCAWRAADKPSLIDELTAFADTLEGQAPPLSAVSKALLARLPERGVGFALVARSIGDLREKIRGALRHLTATNGGNPLPAETVFAAAPLAGAGRLALLFSGQGSQYPDMLREMAVSFPEVAAAIEEADRVLAETPTFRDRAATAISRLIYPPDRFTPAEEQAARAALTSTDVAQPALGTVEAGLWSLMQSFGLTPDMAAGHSYGEYAALYAAEALSLPNLLKVSEARGRLIIEAAKNGELGTMAAVGADKDTILAAVGDIPDLVCANFNGPAQTIISGTEAAIAAALERLQAKDIWVSKLPVAAGFHSPLMQPAQEPLADFIRQIAWNAPVFPVFSNTAAAAHSIAPEEIHGLLARHLTEPVNFVGMIESMYAQGARIFVEIGPKSVLSDLTRAILGTREHCSVALDGNGGGLAGFLGALAGLVAHAVPLDLGRLFRGRTIRDLDLKRPKTWTQAEPVSRSAWMINGGQAFRPGSRPPAAPGRRHAAATTGAAAPTPTVAPTATPAHALPPAAQAGRVTTVRATPSALARDILGEAKVENQRPHGKLVVDNYPLRGKGNGEYRTVRSKSAAEGHIMPNEYMRYEPHGVSSTDRTMSEYYRTMRFFLETQERLMMAYLNRAGNGTPSPVAAFGMPIDSEPALGLAEPPMPAFEPPPVAAAPAHAAVAYAAPAAPAPMPRVLETAPPAPAAAVVQPPAPAAPAPQPAAAESPPAGQPTDFKAILLRLVSDRTGYPEDMLDLTQNIEADLGIDSIKRVEILGLFQKELPSSLGEALRGEMEVLSKASSLQAILDHVAKKAGQETQRPFELAGEGENAICATLPRLIIKAHAEPVAGVPLEPLPAGLYLITADEGGVAAALAALLTADGARAAVVPPDVLVDRGRLREWVAGQRRAEARIRAVIHLAPLDAPDMPESISVSAWRARMDRDVKSLFALLRFTADDLGEGGRVIAASAMGGHFGRDAITNNAVRRRFPGGGGNVGLIKSLALEWQNCRCKAIDLDPTLSAERLAGQLHQELRLPGGRREVGYPGGERTIFRTTPASLAPVPIEGRRPDRSWVVLAVGGARGITAETLRDLAKAGSTLVLVGRSPLPAPEPAEVQERRDRTSLRTLFMQQAKAAGEAVRVIDIERRIDAVVRDREIRSNIEDFVSVGARIDYRHADVRDDEQVRALLDAIYAEHGRIDAVIFGAGLIEDALLVNKTDESIARVFDTKVDSAFAFSRHLRPESLRYLAVFTSVAGRYGNRGQSDYAAANETISRLAWLLQASWGPRVKVSALHWGPWAPTKFGAGMVTPETRQQFEQRGVKLVEPDQGRWFLMQDLLCAPVEDVEVVAGDTPWEYYEAHLDPLPEPPGAAERFDPRLPLLRTAARRPAAGETRSLSKIIDLVSDPYLDHHRLDAIPVLPFVCAAEYMAEAAEALFGTRVAEMRDIRRLRGVTLDPPAQTIEIDVLPGAAANEVVARMWAIVGGERRPAYSATCVLSSEILPAPAAILAAVAGPSPVTVATAYNRYLFHGPIFQTITDIVSLDEKHLRAKLKPTRPSDFYPPARDTEWLFDPGVLDAALQLVLVWSRTLRDATPLPTRMAALQRFGNEPLAGELTLSIDFLTDPSQALNLCCFSVYDRHNRLRYRVEDLESVATPALNRLGGGWAGGRPMDLQP